MRPSSVVGMFAMMGLLAATGCAGQPDRGGSRDEPVPSATESGQSLRLVVVGDSIPFNLALDCPGCTGFVDSFAERAGDELGVTVVVSNRSRHDGASTQDIADQLDTDDTLVSELAEADIVLLSFGFNDQPPYWTGGEPCQTVNEDDDLATIVAALAATTTECVDANTARIGALGSGILQRVRELAPDSAIGALNSYNSWIGWSNLDAYPESVGGVAAVSVYALDAWDEELCTLAEAVKAVCVDIYHAFNGADGMGPAGDLLAADHTHPSQSGNDAIRDVLLNSDLLAVVAANAWPKP
jgi:lysophospholipase L1-like esterase